MSPKHPDPKVLEALDHLPAPDLTDPDNPEWTEVDFARAVRAVDLPAEILAAFPKTPRRRGPNKNPVKRATTIRLSQSVLDYYRASGTGWQARMNADLEDLVGKRSR